MQGKLGRPSPALVIAMIALFAALGGTSYGLARNSIDSREIKNNDVRSKDLRNNDVRSGDIRAGAVQSSDLKDNSVTGTDVDESSLGTVPNATSAGDAAALGGVASAGYARKTLEPVHIVGKAGEPVFQNDWGFFQFDNVGFWKDEFGVVYLQGALDPANGPTNGTTAFTVPTGYRPPVRVTFTGREGQGPNAENEDCRVTVFEDGQLQVSTIPNAPTSDVGSCHLNGILYRTQ